MPSEYLFSVLFSNFCSRKFKFGRTAPMKRLALLIAIPTLALAADGEVIPPNEAAATEATVQMIRQMVQTEFTASRHAKRDAHHKQHGCVRAEFEVLPRLPADYAVAVFAQPRTYPAWIRYSNGSGASQDDHDGDGRGMAIKVMDVAGDKLLDDEPTSQDFLMINHPVFFVRNAADYVEFQRAAMNGNPLPFFLNPFRIFHELLIGNAIRSHKVTNPLATPYWSMTPSKIGARQMKFSVSPCAGSVFTSPSDSRDFLRDNLANHLGTKDACFDFSIQLRTRDSQPIEDPTIEWKESEAPYRHVARVRIPAQRPDVGEFCETLSLNPWHGSPELRPLGGIQRVRKRVYQEVSALRHQLNAQPLNDGR